MAVKSLSIAEWCDTTVIEPMAHCIMTRVSAATFPEKSREAQSLAFNKAFNATDSLFNSPVLEAAYLFFRSLLALRVNGYYGWTNKEKVDDYRRWI